MHIHGVTSPPPQAPGHAQQQATAAMAARRAEVTRNRLRRESAKVQGDKYLSDEETGVTRIGDRQEKPDHQKRDEEDSPFAQLFEGHFSGEA